MLLEFPPMPSKIKSENQVIKIVKQFKKSGKRVVTYNGSFDLLHKGHVKSIEEARSQGEILVVLLNSDESVRIYKGPKRPIILEHERAAMLAALQDVDYVTIFNEVNPKRILDKIKPDIHCSGADWGENCIEREVVEKNGGKIFVLSWHPDFSTTNLIKRINNVYSTPQIKAVFLDRDGTINENSEGYIHQKEKFIFTKGALDALRKLSNSDYKLIIITNQSGVGREYFTQNDIERLHEWLIGYLEMEGILLDRIYYCPHHPNDSCNCRKPNIGMLTQAVKDFGISLNDSWMIGDDERDVSMGREVNLKVIKLGAKMKEELKLEPHYYASNLKEAVDIILP